MIPVTQPARHRYKSRKTPIPSGPTFGLRAKVGKLQLPGRSEVLSQSKKTKTLLKTGGKMGLRSLEMAFFDVIPRDNEGQEGPCYGSNR